MTWEEFNEYAEVILMMGMILFAGLVGIWISWDVMTSGDPVDNFYLAFSIPLGVGFTGLFVWGIIDNIVDYRRSRQ